ncbi:MAG: hypothetical protein V7K38_04850 [Nostoc sp.]|uniref:hypothetical protein n=1 Tax=Nostoc sp. TaxID=1180 RepID=UPI002FF897D0
MRIRKIRNHTSSKAYHQQLPQPHPPWRLAAGRTDQHCRVIGAISGLTPSIQRFRYVPFWECWVMLVELMGGVIISISD